jgi:hypothetical protein
MGERQSRTFAARFAICEKALERSIATAIVCNLAALLRNGRHAKAEPPLSAPWRFVKKDRSILHRHEPEESFFYT